MTRADTRRGDGVSEELLSIRDAAMRGVKRLRKPQWRDPLDHVKIDIIDGRPGPWLHLYSPFNTECNMRDPVEMLICSFGADADMAQEFVEYEGPPPDSDEYKAAVAQFTGCMTPAPRSEEGR